MTGRKACLKRDLRVVVDTHVLVAAADQELRGEPAAELRLIDSIQSICARIVFSREQQIQTRTHLGRLGYRARLPHQQVPYFKALDRAKKLVITEDPHVLRHAAQIRNGLDVDTFSLHEALDTD